VVEGEVVVETVEGLGGFFFVALGDDEPHAAATRATDASPTTTVVHRGPDRRRPAWATRGSSARRVSAPWCTGSPLEAWGAPVPPEPPSS
jgi:hypothetical protein